MRCCPKACLCADEQFLRRFPVSGKLEGATGSTAYLLRAEGNP